MRRPSHSTSPTLILALAVALTTRGESTSAGPRLAAAGDRPGGPPCPTLADIETAIGFPVRALPVAIDGCMYELTGRYRGVFVTLSYQPATRADDLYAEIKQRVKVKGMNAQPDRLSIGDGGWGYGSRGRREAAAVSQGRLYHVEMDYDLFDTMNVREDAAVRVVELGMRVAPGAKQAASSGAGNGAALSDACMLATNAEVGQIAEEKPEFVKVWSAPAASLGGSNCQYGGGSIQVYRGQAAGAALESNLKAFKADKEPRTPVSGIGDKAFFMIPIPNNPYNRLGLLVVYAGPWVLQLTLDANGEEPIAATRPRLERLARLVLPRLR